MKAFLDSSAFAKRYIEEPGSATVEGICAQADELGLSVICPPEMISALNRRVRERLLSRHQYAIAKSRLAEDIRDADIVNLTPAVIAATTAVLEASPVRAMDALNIACALEWRSDVFVTADARQAKAAERTGLRVKLV